MEPFIELLKEVNVVQIFIIFVGGWIFYNRLKGEFKGEINKLDSEINKLDSKIEKLSEKVEDIDRRLCRIEGSLSTHGHCLFNQDHKEKRAE